MKNITLVLLLTALPSVCIAEGVAKRVYECAYDGGRDASTWQPTGEVALPPPGSPTCIRLSDDYRCSKVIDAQGRDLGQGMFCGSEDAPDFPGIKAYEQ